VAHDCSKHLLLAFGFRWCYAELKDRLAAGEHLSREELDFIGAYAKRRPSGGWQQPDQIAILAPAHELDAELSAEDSAGLHALMAIETVDVNQERLEFLG
jgi:hypothetical protein